MSEPNDSATTEHPNLDGPTFLGTEQTPLDVDGTNMSAESPFDIHNTRHKSVSSTSRELQALSYHFRNPIPMNVLYNGNFERLESIFQRCESFSRAPHRSKNPC